MARICGKYPARKKCKDINKIRANAMYGALIRKLKGKHMFLETRCLKTVFHLRRNSIKRKQMYLINYDKNECKLILNKNSKLRVINKSSTQFLKSTTVVFSSMWLDIQSTKNGNPFYQPPTDLHIVLQDNRLKSGGILGLTLSIREQKTTRKNKITNHKYSKKDVKNKFPKLLPVYKSVRNRCKYVHSILDICHLIEKKYNKKVELLDFMNYTTGLMYVFFIRIM